MLTDCSTGVVGATVQRELKQTLLSNEYQGQVHWQIFLFCHILESVYTKYIEVSVGFVAVLLPARRYASAGLCDNNVSVRLSVRPSVRHTPVLYQNEES